MRSYATGILVGSVFLFPWWMSAVFAIFFIFLFENYIEAAVLCFCLDSSFAPVPERLFLTSTYLFTVLSLCVLMAATALRSSLRVSLS